jgi:hypothetical protein
MPNVPDYSLYVSTKKVSVAQTANANTSIIKGRAPNRYDGYFPLYKGIKLPKNVLISNKFITNIRNFNPLDLPGISLWLDAFSTSNFILSGNSVTQWVDKSGKGYNAVPVPSYGTGSYSANGLNSLPTVSISQNNYMRAPVPSGTFPSGFSMFAVYRRTGVAGIFNSFVNRSTSGLAAPLEGYADWNNNRTIIGIGNGSSQSSATIAGTTDILASGSPAVLNISTYPSYNSIDVSLNGTNTSYVISTAPYSDAASEIQIGYRPPAGGVIFGVFNISEMIWYSSNITNFQRQQVEGYLAWKWGLQANLPISHPFKNSVPTVDLPALPGFKDDNYD